MLPQACAAAGRRRAAARRARERCDRLAAMSRKYGQRGYMEGERREPSGRGGGARSGAAPLRREPPPARHDLDRPRGRGLGAPSEETFRCAVCGTQQAAPQAAMFDAACEKCGADLHTCTNCTHFDTAARWECRRWEERQAAALGPAAKKSKRNDCPLYTAKATLEFAQEKPAAADPDDPRAAFDALFKL
jgi:hypothetical protein